MSALLIEFTSITLSARDNCIILKLCETSGSQVCSLGDAFLQLSPKKKKKKLLSTNSPFDEVNDNK
jgi:cobyric acid synthase